MSLAVFCSGNFHYFWSHIGSNSTVKFLKLGSRWVSYKPFDVRKAKIQPIQPVAQIVDEVRWESHRSITDRSSLPKLKKENLRSSKIIWNDAGSLANKDTTPRPEKLTVLSSTRKSTNLPELHEFKAVHCYDIKEGTSVRTSIDRPATILVFDTETTGFNGRIIEFAVRDLIGGKNSTFESLVNPEKFVKNSDIHGIYSNMVNRPDVPTFKELIPILLQYVQSRQMPGRPILWVAHNGRSFDVRVLIKEFQRCSMDIPADWMFVDTLPLARQLKKEDGSKLSSYSLDALREHYKIPLVGPAHRAMADVTTLCYVLQRISFDLKLTVPQLMEKGFRASDLKDSPRKKKTSLN
ncbi:hypothetical protein Cni_G15411 [Canna indica]|uniref:Exonuclease domain-containing protein n=1 Tax=Canna indica TaxID=4628 RepID=A0AAQ3KHU4_9LILI|nr:hypothetical protein Cni_G15411 [Canna indica]